MKIAVKHSSDIQQELPLINDFVYGVTFSLFTGAKKYICFIQQLAQWPANRSNADADAKPSRVFKIILFFGLLFTIPYLSFLAAQEAGPSASEQQWVSLDVTYMHSPTSKRIEFRETGHVRIIEYSLSRGRVLSDVSASPLSDPNFGEMLSALEPITRQASYYSDRPQQGDQFELRIFLNGRLSESWGYIEQLGPEHREDLLKAEQANLNDIDSHLSHAYMRHEGANDAASPERTHPLLAISSIIDNHPELTKRITNAVSFPGTFLSLSSSEAQLISSLTGGSFDFSIVVGSEAHQFQYFLGSA